MQLQPTAADERHRLLDVLRGFALFGVLLANMNSHSGYFFLNEEGLKEVGSSKADHLVEWFEHFLIEGKFYSLFSMLFGIGFGLQMSRASQQNSKFLPRFSRRIAIMFLLGLLHAVLLYVGDILTVYAITALFLLLFRNASDKTLLRATAVFIILPMIQYAVMLWIHMSNPDKQVVGLEDSSFFQQVIQIYRTGSYKEVIELNIGGLIIGRYPDLIFTGRFFRVLAMFLVGLYIARHMIYAKVAENRALIRKTLIWGAVIGIPCNIALAMMMEYPYYYALQPKGIIQPIVYGIGVPALSLFYAAAIALLFEKNNWKKGLLLFAPVGQMALTNYLMQSVICAFIFVSWGLGMTAKVTPVQYMLIGVAIYLFQLIISPIWLKYFRFGPMEWLWRTLTYMKRQPFLR